MADNLVTMDNDKVTEDQKDKKPSLGTDTSYSMDFTTPNKPQESKPQTQTQTETKGQSIEDAERIKPVSYDNKKQPESVPIGYEQILKEYGNNFFELWTYDRNSIPKHNGLFKMAGVLSQLPSFSMASDWQKGPRCIVG